MSFEPWDLIRHSDFVIARLVANRALSEPPALLEV
jgi:hypothetical protein